MGASCIFPAAFTVGVVSYLDTLAIWLPKRPSESILHTLREKVGHLHVRDEAMKISSTFKCRLQVHQPSAEGLQILDDLYEPKRSIVNQAHIALDLLCNSRRDATTLGCFVQRHFVQQWYRRHQQSSFNAGFYSKRKRWQVHAAAIYFDRPSKIAGRPCVHVEWRSNGVSKVRSLNVMRPSDFFSMRVDEFWRKRLVLEDVDLQALGRQFLGRNKAKTVKSVQYGNRIIYEDGDVRVGDLLLRGRISAENDCDEGGPFALDVRRWCKNRPGFRVESLMRRIPVDSLLEDLPPMLMSQTLTFPSRAELVNSDSMARSRCRVRMQLDRDDRLIQRVAES